MPIDEYRCSKCGDVFEKLEKMSDAPLQVHEVCGGPVERLISKSGFSLKGTGWYVTDYGKGGSTPKTESQDSKDSKDSKESKESKESSSSESKPSETKTETTTETKTESKPAATTTKTDQA